MIRTMRESEQFLENHIHSGATRNRGTDRIVTLLRRLDNPEKDLSIIHVGGTAGKASTAILTAAILETHGLRIGTYTKPHLITPRERMLINRIPITDHAFITYCDRVARTAMDIEKHDPALSPSYSEILLAMALCYFRDKHVDGVVIEVGIGGMHDATNIVSPRVCILTNIGKTHTNVLGKTLAAIAQEKMGIIKPHIPCVTAVTQPTLIRLIQTTCQKLDAPLFRYRKECSATHMRIAQSENAERKGYQLFDYVSKDYMLKNILLSLRGTHQAINATLAITAARLFTHISDTDITQALSTCAFPGRLDIITYGGKTIIMDGAHNPKKMKACTKTVQSLFPKQKFPVYFPLKHNDDIDRMFPYLTPMCTEVIFVRFDMKTPKDIQMETHLEDIMGHTMPAVPFRVIDINDLPEHFRTQKKMMIVVGSLTLIGIIRDKLSIPWSLTQTHI